MGGPWRIVHWDRFCAARISARARGFARTTCVFVGWPGLTLTLRQPCRIGSPHHPFPMTICRCTAVPRKLAWGSLSAAITVALKRFVDVADGQQEGYDEITVKVGRVTAYRCIVADVTAYRCMVTPATRRGQEAARAAEFQVSGAGAHFPIPWSAGGAGPQRARSHREGSAR